MDQGLRRVICLFALVIVTGCSSDEKKSNDVREDASVDSGDEPSAPDKDASSGGEKKDSGAAPSGGSSCDDLKCNAPATCSMKDGKAHCGCPSGYDDPKGDGSECKDKDECADDGANDCGKHATCKNTPGGFECSCESPAYTGDGKSC
jgi:hypothetical protein